MYSKEVKVNDILCFNNDKYYQILLQLGVGSYGQVFKGQDTKTGEYVAIKVQSHLNDKEKELLTQLMGARLQNNVQILGFIDNGYQAYVIQQYCGLNLYDRICKSVFKEQDFRYLMKQIANGIKELHQLNFVHRDIKPENILIYEIHDKATNQLQITYKICDYGLVSQQNLINTANVGTPLYQAPEQIRTTKYGKPVDIWALGAVMYELITGISLFSAKSLKEIQNQVFNLDIDKQIDSMPKINMKYKSLLKQMLNRDPTQRPTIEQIVIELKAEMKIYSPRARSPVDVIPQNNSIQINQSNFIHNQNKNNSINFQNTQNQQESLYKTQYLNNPLPTKPIQNPQVINSNHIRHNSPILQLNMVKPGQANIAKPNSPRSVIMMNQGQNNIAQPNSPRSVIMMNQGQNNIAQPNSPRSVIMMNQGQNNIAQPNSQKSVIMMNQGQNNIAQPNSQKSVIAMNQGQTNFPKQGQIKQINQIIYNPTNSKNNQQIKQVNKNQNNPQIQRNRSKSQFVQCVQQIQIKLPIQQQRLNQQKQ